MPSSATTLQPPLPGEEAALVTDPRRQLMVLIALCTALVAVVASMSGLNVAQQALSKDLGASQSALLWIINGYTVALASLLLPLGAIGDRWGRKWLLVGGLVVFGGASVAAAMAGSVTVMLIARVVAGAGAALIMPVTLSTITSTFPPERKSTAIGIWSGLAAAGGIIGLFVSSVIVDNFTWPWVFAMPVAFTVISLGFTLTFVGNSREHDTGRFDVLGSFLSAVAIGALVLGIHEGPEKGWSSTPAMAGIVVGLAALAAFIGWERRHENPLFDVRVFANRSLAAGSIALLVAFGVMSGLFLVLMQFLQAVLSYSAIRAASGLLPMAAVMMTASSLSPRIAERLGTRRTLTIGLSVFTAGLVLLAAFVSAEVGYWSVLPGLVVLGLGIGLTMTPGTTAITGALPESQQGVASALNDTVRELGGALGVALLGSMLNSGYQSSLTPLRGTLDPGTFGAVKEGIGSALAVAGSPGTSSSTSAAILGTARDAFVDGWRLSIWVGAGFAAAALVFVVLRGPSADAGAPASVTDYELQAVLEAELVTN